MRLSSSTQNGIEPEFLDKFKIVHLAPYAPSMRLAGVNGLEEGMASGRGFL